MSALKCLVVMLLVRVEKHRYTLASEIVESKCVSNRSQCEEAELKSSWTQGGYYASCRREDSDQNYNIKIFVVRNVYNCNGENSPIKLMKIANSYYDAYGKLCHLIHGDKQCPGISNSTRLNKQGLHLSLFCGEYKCRMQYHRCDFCPVVPWYSWFPEDIPRSVGRKMGCKHLFITSKLVKKNGQKVCLRCDGSIVPKRFCDNAEKSTYFVDLHSSRPSWSEWVQLSECKTSENRSPACVNGTLLGKVSYIKYCRYPNIPAVRLNPKYCGSVMNTVTLHCSVKLPRCSAKFAAVGVRPLPKRWRKAHTWLVILIIALLAVVLVAFWIFIKYRELRWKSNGEYKLLPTSIFESCATQTSPRYSPRRIISEPEYALIGDWRRNVHEHPQPKADYIFADDPLYAEVEQRRLSDDSLNSEDEIVDASETSEQSRFLNDWDTEEHLDLKAAENRALYAKVRKFKSQT